jgi:hypothetical protein
VPLPAQLRATAAMREAAAALGSCAAELRGLAAASGHHRPEAAAATADRRDESPA